MLFLVYTPRCSSDSLECQGVRVHGREQSHLFLGVLKSLGHQEGHEVGAGPTRTSTTPRPRVVPPRLGSLDQVTTQVLTLRKTKMATVFRAISEEGYFVNQPSCLSCAFDKAKRHVKSINVTLAEKVISSQVLCM